MQVTIDERTCENCHDVFVTSQNDTSDYCTTVCKQEAEGELTMKYELGYYGCPNCGTSKAMIYGDSAPECNGCGRAVDVSCVFETAALQERIAH